MAYHLSKTLSCNDEHTIHVFSDKSIDGVENGMISGSHLQCDVIVIGGGGIVNPDFWAFKNGGLTKIIESQKPVAFININVTSEVTKNPEFAEMLRALKAKWWVRTKQSAEHLAEIGIASTVVPDISFRTGVVPAKHTMAGKKKMSVFLNSYVFNDLLHNNDVGQFVQALHNCRVIAKYCDWMTKFGWNITFYSAHTAKMVDDRIPSALVFGTMTEKSSANWVSEPLSWDELVREISHSDLVLSMRFHSTTTALSAGVPCVDITHHAKNKSLIEEIGIQPVSVEYALLTHDALVKAAQFAENSPIYETKVHAYCSEAVTRWELFDHEWNTFLKNIE